MSKNSRTNTAPVATVAADTVAADTVATVADTADSQKIDSGTVPPVVDNSAAVAALVEAAQPKITAAALSEVASEKAALVAAINWLVADMATDYNITHGHIKSALEAAGMAPTTSPKAAARVINNLKIGRRAIKFCTDLEGAISADNAVEAVTDMACRFGLVVETATAYADLLTGLVSVATTAGGPVTVATHKGEVKAATLDAAKSRKAAKAPKQPTASGKSTNGGNQEGGEPEGDDSSAVAQSLGAMTKAISLAMAAAYQAPSIAQAVTIMAREWSLATGAEMP